MAKTKTKTTTEPTVMMREGQGWRQYLVVRDEAVTIVHMVPAGLGSWNIQRTDFQGSPDWPNMTQAQIVAFKIAGDDGRTVVNPTIDSVSFRKQLIEVAFGASRSVRS